MKGSYRECDWRVMLDTDILVGVWRTAPVGGEWRVIIEKMREKYTYREHI